MKKLIFFLFPLIVTTEKSPTQEFAEANTLFTQDVYKQLIKTQNGNFVLSPFSAETALAFTQSGCKGESAEEIRTALHLPNDKNKVESAFKTLLPKIKSNDLYTLHTANKMYVQENFSINDEFKATADLVYSSGLESVQFSKNVDAANTMNKWVEKQTNQKIKNLINSDDLNADTRAVLINALYLKANWSNQFTTHSTLKKEFYKTSTDTKKVDFMHHYEEHFNFYLSPELKAQILELPFQSGEVSMVIVLPNEKNGLTDLEKNLEQVFTAHRHLKAVSVNVALPKFKIETSIEFTSILKELGVSKIFDQSQADLSGIAGNKGDLFVDKVAQKTFIEVNEGGVEAAAATFLLVVLESASFETPKSFNADHPFIFYIKFKDVILFAGRVIDP